MSHSNETILVPVTGYVHQFLLKVAGPGPYLLTDPSYQFVRDIYLDISRPWQWTSQLYEAEKIELDIGNSLKLKQIYADNLHRFDSILFGVYEFYRQLFLQINLTKSILEEMGEGKRTKNNSTMKATRDFLKRYDINEETYSLDAAYMQYMRMQRKYPKLIP